MAPSKTSALPIDLTANTTAYREAITGKKAITPQKADHLVATLYYSLGKEILAWQKAGKTPDELEGIATHYVAGFLAGTGDYYQHHPVEPLPRPSEANDAQPPQLVDYLLAHTFRADADEAEWDELVEQVGTLQQQRIDEQIAQHLTADEYAEYVQLRDRFDCSLSDWVDEHYPGWWTMVKRVSDEMILAAVARGGVME